MLLQTAAGENCVSDAKCARAALYVVYQVQCMSDAMYARCNVCQKHCVSGLKHAALYIICIACQMHCLSGALCVRSEAHTFPALDLPGLAIALY